jgi:hypothetical protein
MKQLFLLTLIASLIGCGTSSKSSTTPTGNSPPTSQASPLVGSWTGRVTGSNFTGSANWSMLICYQNGLGTCAATSGTSVFLEDETMEFDCGNLAPGAENIALTVNGQNFSGSGSGTTGPGQGSLPWTFSLSGTVASDNQTVSGDFSFSLPPCGTSTNPWTGTFSATLQP